MATIVKRTAADGKPRYQAIVRKGGHRRKKQFIRRRDAEVWARDVEARIDKGEALPDADAASRTVADALDLYLASGAVSALLSAEPREKQIRWWRRRLGSLRISALKKAHIRAALKDLETGGVGGRPLAASSRRRYLSALTAAFNWAIDSDLMVSNPASKAARKGVDLEPPGRTRHLADEEAARLLEECAKARDPRLLALVRLALLTAMRRGELLSLRWSPGPGEDGWVDLERRLAILPETKAGRIRRARGGDPAPRNVELSGKAVEILRELHARRVVGWPHVFAAFPSGRPIYPRKQFVAACRRAGIEDFHFHDLRHCAATYLLTAGSTLLETQKALGHHTAAMVERYSHLEKAHGRRLAERLAERIG